MHTKYYFQLHNKKLDLDDHLALDRTNLANERTFLAYIRTSLTLFVAGVSFIQFFSIKWLIIAGWIFIPLAVVVLVRGWYVYQYREQIFCDAENNSD